jgi:hypothetical protein
MSNRRYIEISSAYRDRKRFPLVSKFEVPLSQTGNKTNSFTAYDPIINSYPSYKFQGDYVSRLVPVAFNGGTYAKPVLDPSASNVDGYYNGYLLVDNTLNSTRTILNYIGSTQEAILDRPFSSAWSVLDTYTLIDPSLGSSGRNITPAEAYGVAPLAGAVQVVLGASAVATDGYYNGMLLTDTANGDQLVIYDYDGATKTAYVSEPFTGGAATYTVTATTFKINIQPVSLSGVAPVDIDNFYTGDLLFNETISPNQGRVITNYDAATHTVTIDSGYTGLWNVNDTYSIRKALPSILVQAPLTYTLSFGAAPPNPGPGFNTVQLNLANPPTFNYAGFYLYPIGIDQAYLITNHDMVTNTVTIVPSPTSVFPATVTQYQILQFSRDNLVPLTFTGTVTTAVNYEIELLNIVIPNVKLKNGSRVSFYPYFYVEFSNASGSNSIDRNIIYSNNPNAVRQLFVVPTTDISDPLISKFIKLESNDMVQTVKFSPYDNIYFSLTLPNGHDFEPDDTDNYSPLLPKPELQISAVFSIKRL